jgi:hypothetical protein
MSDVVNLRRVRKRGARENAELKGAARRAKFGTAPAARRAEAMRLESAARKLEAHWLDPSRSGRPDDAE